jgi:putative redox protein
MWRVVRYSELRSISLQFTPPTMTIKVIRDITQPMRHIVHIDKHLIPVDLTTEGGGSDSGVDPHDLYDAALGSCKALTVLWYARRKAIPLEDIRVHVERDGSEERSGTYRLKTILQLSGPLSDEQRQELLTVADKCPVHKLMTKVQTLVTTELAA